MAVGVLEIAKMSAAGGHVFGARRLNFWRASARAGIAHRCAPIGFIAEVSKSCVRLYSVFQNQMSRIISEIRDCQLF
jgi:hypothetical protein